ncbi:MAG: hypothetical protein HZB15_18170 [Actinobacteria bacterium]|nr:hypothetical protein [Actinomycetota bacterium]
MSRNLYLVFSEKPESLTTDEYHRWYVDHAQENIESPGFVSAQRYVVQEIANSEPVGPEEHLSLYEYEGDMSTWRTDLTRRIKEGDVVLPDFFKDIKFMSFRCEPTGGLLVPKTH